MSGSSSSNRLVSLDAFRGFTIAAMVLVNNPGDWGALYKQLDHAKWNGWTFTDWIFPFFLFIGGVSMAFSLGRRAEAGDDKPQLLIALAKRAAIIFGIGLTLNLIPTFDFAHLRIPGVLQRIALCTLFAAPIVVYCDWRKQLMWIGGLFAFYSVLQLCIPVPGIGRGVLEPGKDFASWFDRLLLSGHLWAKVKTWDPEGIITTIPALCSQLFGVLTGRWLLTGSERREKATKMIVAGFGFCAVGVVLDRIFMPINKSLWTPSYSIMMTGFALFVFGAFYAVMDVHNKAKKLFLPFNIYGMNALFIFALSGLISKMMNFWKVGGRSLKTIVYTPIKALPLSPENTSLLFAIMFNLVMFTIAWGMWRKKWFVKV